MEDDLERGKLEVRTLIYMERKGVWNLNNNQELLR